MDGQPYVTKKAITLVCEFENSVKELERVLAGDINKSARLLQKEVDSDRSRLLQYIHTLESKNP